MRAEALKIDAAAVTDAGPFKQRNEDVVLAERGLYLVADGMGGRPLGERAAAVTASLFPALCTGAPRPAALRSAFHAVNDALIAESRARGLSEPMAAVATIAWLSETGRLLLGHVGDTRALLFDADGAGCQLTRDHSAVDADAIPESESLASPGRNVVAAALGLEPWGAGEARGRVDLHAVSLREGQTLVIVSDGVSDYLDRARVAQVVAEHKGSARRLAQALISAAVQAQKAAGRGDNLGVVVARRPKARASEKRMPSAAAVRAAAAAVAGFIAGASAEPLWRMAHPVPEANAALADVLRAHCAAEVAGACQRDLAVSARGAVSLGGVWDDASVWAVGAWTLAPSEPMRIPRGKAVTLSAVDAAGTSPLVIELEAGARLTLVDARIVLHGSTARIVLGPGATLELVRSRLDAQRIELEASPGAIVQTYASLATVREGTNPLDPTPTAAAPGTEGDRS